MDWFAVAEEETGRLVSVATVVASPLPPGLIALPLPTRPPDDEMWDAGSQSFVPRPPKVLVDRLDDLKADPRFAAMLNALNAADQAGVLGAIGELLGTERFRNEDESAKIGVIA